MIPLDVPFLTTTCQPWRIRVVEETGSTSDDARASALAGEEPGLVILAEAQTAGRGRRENRWQAPAGKDLMFTLLIRPEAPVALWPRMTTLAALAICKAIEEELPLYPQIKWPNDVYLRDRKVSGLLAEVVITKTGPMLVLGIGLNVNTREFSAELADTATSLLISLPQSPVTELDRNSLAASLLRHLHEQSARLDDGFHEAVSEVRERSWLLGRQVRATVDGTEIYGQAMDLDLEGHLRLALPDGSLRTLSSAESVRQVV